MQRRSLILAILISPICVPAAAAGTSALEMGWNNTDKRLRKKAQAALIDADLYFGEADGLWGHALERALRRAADRVTQAPEAPMKPQLRSASGASRFIEALGLDELSHFLTGEACD